MFNESTHSFAIGYPYQFRKTNLTFSNAKVSRRHVEPLNRQRLFFLIHFRQCSYQ